MQVTAMLANLSLIRGTVRAIACLEIRDLALMDAFQTFYDKPLGRALVSVNILSYRLIPKQARPRNIRQYKASLGAPRELHVPPDLLNVAALRISDLPTQTHSSRSFRPLPLIITITSHAHPPNTFAILPPPSHI